MQSDPLLVRIRNLLEIYSLEELLELMDLLPEEVLQTLVEDHDYDLPEAEPL